MFTLDRADVARFRAVVRRLAPARAKGPASEVVVSADRGMVTLAARHDGVILTLDVTGTHLATGCRVVPVTELDAALAGDADPVAVAGEVADAGPPFAVPARPKRFAPVAAEFVAALNACGRTTTSDPHRFALTRVQVRGAAGDVRASDGKVALTWAGFRFPFRDDILVPAVSVFGTRELQSTTEVGVALAGEHLVVGPGPWTVWLPVDRAGRFPEIETYVPRARTPTVLTLSESDADALVRALPTLPGGDLTNRPVTFDTAPGPVVRAACENATPVEVPLRTSAATGGPGEVALDRAFVHRALTLGLREVRIVAADKPVVFADATRTFLVMALDSSLIVPRLNGVAVAVTPDPAPTRRRFPVRPDSRPPADPPDPPADDADPLAAAEDLRATLAAATQAAHRLVQTLKARKKEHRALTQVWSSLRSLKLPP